MRRAIAAVRKLEAYLATGMVSLANIFNPSDIVLGGMMRPVLELGLDRLRQAVAAGIVPGVTPPAIALSRGNPVRMRHRRRSHCPSSAVRCNRHFAGGRRRTCVQAARRNCAKFRF